MFVCRLRVWLSHRVLRNRNYADGEQCPTRPRVYVLTCAAVAALIAIPPLRSQGTSTAPDAYM